MQQSFLDTYPDMMFYLIALLTVQDDVASKSWISSSDINRMCPWISFASYWIVVNLVHPGRRWCRLWLLASKVQELWDTAFRWAESACATAILWRAMSWLKYVEPTSAWGKKRWGERPMANGHDLLSWWDHSCGDNILHDHDEACAYPASPLLTYHQLEIQVESPSRGPTIY